MCLWHVWNSCCEPIFLFFDFICQVEDREVIEEVHQDLCFEERLLVNGRISFEADSCTKEAVSQLAFKFWKLSTYANSVSSKKSSTESDRSLRRKVLGETTNTLNVDSDIVSDIVVLRKLYSDEKSNIQDSMNYKYCYEDTLKVLMIDIERIDIWGMWMKYSHSVNIGRMRCVFRSSC